MPAFNDKKVIEYWMGMTIIFCYNRESQHRRSQHRRIAYLFLCLSLSHFLFLCLSLWSLLWLGCVERVSDEWPHLPGTDELVGIVLRSECSCEYVRVKFLLFFRDCMLVVCGQSESVCTVGSPA